MVSKAEVLAADWKLLRVEVSPHDEDSGVEAYDGYSRFWSKQAVFGAYWIAERVEETTVRLHLTEDIELVGFEEALSFRPDIEFTRELLTRFDWEEVVHKVFPMQESGQLSLFEGDEGEQNE